MEIEGIARTLAIVTKKLEIYEILASGEEPTTSVWGGWMWGSRGYPYTEEIMICADIFRYRVMIVFLGSHMMCILYVCGVVIYTKSYKGRYPNRVLPQHNIGKNYKYLDSCHNHRWELTGNYPHFIVVMVICHYNEIILMILITPRSLYNI